MSLFAGVNFRTGSDQPKGQEQLKSAGTDKVKANDSAAELSLPDVSSAPAPVQWSAALRFAPSAASRKKAALAAGINTTNNASQAAISAPAKSGGFKSITASTASATSVSPAATPAPYTSSSIPPLPGLSAPTSITSSTQSSFFAAPAVAAQSSSVTEYATTDAQGRKVFKPPAMTLEPGAGGSAGSAAVARKRPAEQMTGGGGPGGGGRSKKKGRKNAALFANPETLPFDPHEPYNPSRPTDLTEYVAYRKQYREERYQHEKEEEARKRADGTRGGSGSKAYPASDESSYYSEDEEEERKTGQSKGWAPPVGLYGSGTAARDSSSQAPSFRRAPQPDDEGDESGSYASPAPPTKLPSFTAASSFTSEGSAAPPQLKAATQAASGEEAYQRRLALSQQRTETADEAYARRVAMSSGGSEAPLFASSSGSTYSPPQPPVQPTGPPSFSAPKFTPSPSPFGDYVALSETEATPADLTIPSPGLSGLSASEAPVPENDFARKLEERKAAAAAIAAKFAAIAPPPPPKDEDPEDLVERMAREVEKETAENSGTFAEKMMRRWGHQEGHGLGKDGEGIVHAFSAEHVKDSTTITSNNAKKSKANLVGSGPGGTGQWVQSTSSKGRLVNLNEDEKKREEKEKYGEPSRVVLLRNVVGRVEEADEDLSGEIGEECGKNGIVERVVLHAVEPPSEDPSEGLRIFIQFSGLAGAWRTLKEMDGRFFGGRQVRATYFDEVRFTRGDRNGKAL